MVLPVLLVMILVILQVFACCCRCGGKVVVSVGVQTDEFVQHEFGLRYRNRHCQTERIYVAPRAGECFHCSKDCRGLSGAIEVKELRPCKVCLRELIIQC